MVSKRFEQATSQVEDNKVYGLEEAIGVLKQMPPAKFDETVELAAAMNLDAKKSDQAVRGTVVLPHGTGKTRRVAVFCRGEKELIAKEAGADHVGSAELIDKVQGGWLDFDVAIATPDLMRDVSRLGKILGPRGMMPNPKVGTVTEDVAKAIQEVKQGKIEFKMDKQSNIQLVIGKRSFTSEQLAANARAGLEAMMRARPVGAKGRMLRHLSVCSTMSPGIPLTTDGLGDGVESE